MQTYWGLDMRRDLSPAWDLHGRYSTDVFTEEAERVIAHHNASSPLFLYLAHVAPHSGNPYNPLPAHDQDVAKFDIIPEYNRRRYAGESKSKSASREISRRFQVEMSATICLFLCMFCK